MNMREKEVLRRVAQCLAAVPGAAMGTKTTTARAYAAYHQDMEELREHLVPALRLLSYRNTEDGEFERACEWLDNAEAFVSRREAAGWT